MHLLKTSLLIYNSKLPPGHEDKLLSLSGVNVHVLPDNWFWRVRSVACRSLIAVKIVVHYDMTYNT